MLSYFKRISSSVIAKLAGIALMKLQLWMRRRFIRSCRKGGRTTEIMWVFLIKITGQALSGLFWHTMLFSTVGGDSGMDLRLAY
jgi:hypothetical protein